MLDFDHVKGDKIENVSIMINSGASLERLILEIEKCEIRCANCHRRKTAKDFGSYRLTMEGALQSELDALKPFPRLSKISFETAQAIRRDYKPYEFGFRRLEKKYGISSRTIRAIVKNKTHTEASLIVENVESDNWFI